MTIQKSHQQLNLIRILQAVIHYLHNVYLIVIEINIITVEVKTL